MQQYHQYQYVMQSHHPLCGASLVRTIPTFQLNQAKININMYMPSPHPCHKHHHVHDITLFDCLFQDWRKTTVSIASSAQSNNPNNYHASSPFWRSMCHKQGEYFVWKNRNSVYFTRWTFSNNISKGTPSWITGHPSHGIHDQAGKNILFTSQEELGLKSTQDVTPECASQLTMFFKIVSRQMNRPSISKSDLHLG